MKKSRIFALVATALVSGTLARGQANDGSITIDKETRQAVVITINQPMKITSDALNSRLEASGLKAKTKRGVTTYNKVILPEISPDRVDIYTKVEEGTGNSSIVSMAVSRGYLGLTNSPADSTITVNLKRYLDSFVTDANNHSVEVAINNQVNEVNKEEKNYQKLVDEQSSLNKKKSDIDSRLAEIQRELRSKDEQIIKKKSDLENARAKRGI